MYVDRAGVVAPVTSIAEGQEGDNNGTLCKAFFSSTLNRLSTCPYLPFFGAGDKGRVEGEKTKT
jgi:hypothetical protein